jgi:cytochrome c556
MKAPVIVLSSLLLAGPAAADKSHGEGGHAKAIDYRNSVMTVFKWNMGAMGAVLKGDKPYERESFKRQAQDLATAAHLDLLAGFPEGSDEGEDTEARSDIWMDWEGFQARYSDLKNATRELAETAAGSGGLEAIGPKFSAVGKTCKGCHDAFKD